MPSIRLPENIGTITRASSTSVTLSASRINIGGQQYLSTSNTTMNLNVIGANGLDATRQTWKLYNVFAVVSNGVIALVGSTASAPSGFASYRLVGYFDTDGTPLILSAASSLKGAVGDYKAAHMTEAQFQAANGPGWILADGRSVVGSTWATLSGLTSAPDARGIVLRGKDNSRGANPDGDLSLGSFQNHATAKNGLNISDPGHAHTVGYDGNGAAGSNRFNGGGSATQIGTSYVGTGVSLTGGDNETRMKNITVNHFIKVN